MPVKSVAVALVTTAKFKPVHPARTPEQIARRHTSTDLLPTTFDDAEHFEHHAEGVFKSLMLEAVTAEIARIEQSNPMLARGLELWSAKMYAADASLAPQVVEDLSDRADFAAKGVACRAYQARSDAQLKRLYTRKRKADRPLAVGVSATH
jgi:hypothetical protein